MPLGIDVMQFCIIRPRKDAVLKAPVGQYETVFYFGSRSGRNGVGAHDHAGITYGARNRILAGVEREKMPACVLEHEGGLAGKIGCADHASIAIDAVELSILGAWV